MVACLLLAVVAWDTTRDETRQRIQEQFDFRADRIESDIRNRLLMYEHMLRGGTGLFKGSERVTRHEWKLYVDSLHISQHFPGVQGLGFSKVFPASEKEAHIAEIRAEGFPNYTVYPEGYRPEYTAIVFLEPFDWRNQRAFGYDMFSEPTRREAMIRARDTGRVAMTGKVILVQEDGKAVQPGFLIYIPLYQEEKTPMTISARRDSLVGYVYSPFRMYDFMDGLLVGETEYVKLRIYDGDLPKEDALLYEDDIDDSRAPLFTHMAVFGFGEHAWTLEFRSSDYFESRVDLTKANIILFAGILISLLLASMIFFLTKSRRLAGQLAVLAENAIRTNFRLKQEINSRERAEDALEERAQELDDFNTAMIGRESRVIELKEEVNRLCREMGRSPIYPPVWKEELSESDLESGNSTELNETPES